MDVCWHADTVYLYMYYLHGWTMVDP